MTLLWGFSWKVAIKAMISLQLIDCERTCKSNGFHDKDLERPVAYIFNVNSLFKIICVPPVTITILDQWKLILFPQIRSYASQPIRIKPRLPEPSTGVVVNKMHKQIPYTGADIPFSGWWYSTTRVRMRPLNAGVCGRILRGVTRFWGRGLILIS